VLNELAEPGDAMRVGHTLVEAMRKPFALEGRELYVSVSLGISLFPGDGDDAETLLVNADVAMYRAKEMGRDTFQWFSPEMNVLARERLELEGDLRRALAAGSSTCTTSRRWMAPGASPGWRPCCAGSIRPWATCRRRASSRSPRRPG
jgi:predicted signal transduction protein with EAL and GGDEF domain